MARTLHALQNVWYVKRKKKNEEIKKVNRKLDFSAKASELTALIKSY